MLIHAWYRCMVVVFWYISGYGVFPFFSTSSVNTIIKYSTAGRRCWKQRNSFCNLLSLVFVCWYMYLWERERVRQWVQDWCQTQRLAWHCLIKQRERECMCVYVSLDLGAVLALSSSMQLESALQQRCLIEKAGERVRERLWIRHTTRSLPASTSPLFIVALANYLLSHSSISACSASASLSFHSLPHPLNSSTRVPFHSPSHSLPLLSHFHQIECHSYLPLNPLRLVKKSCWEFQ